MSSEQKQAPAEEPVRIWCPRCRGPHALKVLQQVVDGGPAPAWIILALCGNCQLALFPVPFEPGRAAPAGAASGLVVPAGLRGGL